eukprot:TRINITY_DN10581_c0_g1_i1.p1 TRINITY_DN10581_c0_g1~~TRINITY_DN10581_c0_g1_i1.p1  ORF type:complete len:569 (+),score=66.38 TRINITY_DN10581_c0_g1_i1:87-1793(+)
MQANMWILRRSLRYREVAAPCRDIWHACASLLPPVRRRRCGNAFCNSGLANTSVGTLTLATQGGPQALRATGSIRQQRRSLLTKRVTSTICATAAETVTAVPDDTADSVDRSYSDGSVDQRFFVACAGGLDHVLAKEIRSLGARKLRRLPRGVEFTGSPDVACRVLIWSRTAAAVDEVLVRASVKLESRRELYDFVRSAYPWGSALDPEETLSTAAAVTNDTVAELRNGHFVALVAKDAIVDACREYRGARPNVDVERADWALHLTLHSTGATLARRWSGRYGLHRRGYRTGVKMHRAALRETLAAGLLLLSGVQPISAGEANFGGVLDPMCGGGTFLLEAALLVADIPPGVVREALLAPEGRPWHAVPREWSCVFQKELAAARDQVALNSADAVLVSQQRQALRSMLVGRDALGGALALARRSAAALEHAVPGVTTSVEFELADVTTRPIASPPRRAPRLVCCNPPWGSRLDGDADSADGNAQEAAHRVARAPAETWRELGAYLRTLNEVDFAWVLSPDPALEQALEDELGVGASRRYRVDGGTRKTALAAGFGTRSLEWLRYDLRT